MEFFNVPSKIDYNNQLFIDKLAVQLNFIDIQTEIWLTDYSPYYPKQLKILHNNKLIWEPLFISISVHDFSTIHLREENKQHFFTRSFFEGDNKYDINEIAVIINDQFEMISNNFYNISHGFVIKDIYRI